MTEQAETIVEDALAVEETQDTVPAGNDNQPAADAPTFDWRKEIAGDDEKALKKLDRFSSPTDFFKSYQEAEQKIRAGFQPPKLDKDATEEQIKEYRAKMNIPESPEDYKMPEGLEIPEGEKDLYAGFLATANKYNLTQDEWEKVAPAYKEWEAQLAESIEAESKETARANEQALKERWGSDYQANLNINENFLIKSGGDELHEALGPVANHPAVAAFLNEQARLAGFNDGIVYNGDGGAANVEDEIKTIMKSRTGENRAAYYKDKAQVAKDDARLQELYAIRERITK